jgi:hypothetical protein
MRRSAGPVRLAVALALLVATSGAASGQTTRPFTETSETHYFDFWPGVWYPVVDGRVDSTGSGFIVRRIVNSAAFEEEWVTRSDSGVTRAVAIRAWDQLVNRWRFAWVSPNALFQVWEGEKVGSDWYIVKEFDFEGQRFHSRQAWIPDGRDRLVRIMERSNDGGRTWQPRSRTTFQRVRPAP